MSQSVLQSELFASQDWRVLYQAFTQINFNASDPASIASSMRGYIQNNYPEDFNDWIESSEFVAIIDLLAWLGGTLAFKTDINARENAMEIAEARESILRLARFLSYNPRRNRAATGLLKIVEIRTNDDIFDSSGRNLNNVSVLWDNPDDTNWYERFILILNNAMNASTPFGSGALIDGTVGDIRTQLYRLNAAFGDSILTFNSTVGGSSLPFEVCNGTFTDGGDFAEKSPDPASAINFFYRNDGSGNGSTSTGFFFLFKQGVLSQTTYAVPNASANLLIDVPVDNINETDVWVQNVDDIGTTTIDWTKVPALFSENVTFNSIPADNRNIYSVITRDNDRVSIRFSDGIFGAAPQGNMRVWYRTSAGTQYVIRPSEISRISVPITYYNRNGVARTLTVVLSLQDRVGNASTRETEAEIKRRAPSVYGTQNRMVSGEDYNVFPLSSNLITKLKAVSRIYSGHSRFIDLNDPTGTYQSTNVFADDGMIYRESANRYTEVPLNFNRTPEELLVLDLQPLLDSDEVATYVQTTLITRYATQGVPTVPGGSTWRSVTSANASGTGYFTLANAYYAPGATLLFRYVQDGATVTQWATIGTITGTATTAPVPGQYYGSVSLNAPIPDNATVIGIVPSFVSTLGASVSGQIKTNIEQRSSFSLWFDPSNGQWTARGAETLTNETNASAYFPQIKAASVDYSGAGVWRISVRGTRLVFESENTIKWFHDGSRAIDPGTGLRQNDLVRVIRINSDVLSTSGAGLGLDYDLYLRKLIQYSDGFVEPARIQIGLADADEDGQPDIPDTFEKLVSPNARLRTLFWRKTASTDAITGFRPYQGMRVYLNEADRLADPTAAMIAVEGDVVAYQVNAPDPTRSGTFWVLSGTQWYQETQRFKVATGRGSNMAAIWVDGTTRTLTSPVERTAARLNFQWKHYAQSDHRIDPSITNVHDMFVLTKSYDSEIRQWIANGAVVADMPSPPTELDLRLTFSTYEQFKMESDGMVWRPVRYKLLFGSGADDSMRASFKVIKLPNPSLSDGEIKSRLIKAVNTYFAADQWDFGADFFASELIAYLHTQLVGSISSVEIVPMAADAAFGALQQISSRSDELFISTAQVADVQIIAANTATNLRIR